MSDEKKSFWSTMPGILTGIAAIITAVGGLLLAMNQIGMIQKNGGTSTNDKIGPRSTYSVARIEAPELLSPADGATFSHYPRKTTLAWSYVEGARTYTVEVDCFHCCEFNRWCSDVGRQWKIEKGLTTTSYTFDYVGAQPGRWRVWAVDKHGKSGDVSRWRQFTYTNYTEATRRENGNRTDHVS